jgi:uncharacterized OsmC-like protein
MSELTVEFVTIDPAGLQALAEKGKSDPTAVRTVRCRTIAEGRKYRHLNYVRDLPAHIVDEPKALLGDNTAPNPTEALLAALGTCVAVGLQANAVARGWKINAISLDLEGDINITSVWGVGDLSPKPIGLTEVRIKAHLGVDGATPQDVAEIVAHAAKWSPVFNTVPRQVRMTIESV